MLSLRPLALQDPTGHAPADGLDAELDQLFGPRPRARFARATRMRRLRARLGESILRIASRWLPA